MIKQSIRVLVAASDGNPVITTCVVILFFIMFNMVLSVVEKLLFGERFEHWLDPVFASGFIVYAALAVYGCAEYNLRQRYEE